MLLKLLCRAEDPEKREDQEEKENAK